MKAARFLTILVLALLLSALTACIWGEGGKGGDANANGTKAGAGGTGVHSEIKR